MELDFPAHVVFMVALVYTSFAYTQILYVPTQYFSIYFIYVWVFSLHICASAALADMCWELKVKNTDRW